MNTAEINAAKMNNRLLTFYARSFLLDRMSSSITSLTAQQLRRAADIKDKIQSLEKELGRIFGSSTKPVADAVAPKKRRKMSAAARAKISAAAKARWAKVNGKKVAGKQAPKAKRKMSAAARAKISAAAKARWAKAKATGKKTL